MRHGMIALSAMALALAPASVFLPGLGAAFAQQAAPAPQAAPAQAADTVFTRAEIEPLVKPIALYPDPLLAQLLPASAYPLDIVQAARWIERNKAAVEKADFTAADAMNWDASVKALIRFPDLIKQMNENLDWTSDLGDAFVYQPTDVAAVIQDLRAQAAKGGALKSTPQQTVVQKTEGSSNVIYIEPAEPEVIYVPSYDPGVVYEPVASAVPGALLTFGTAIAVGAVMYNNPWNWGTGAVYPPRWPGYPGYRPGYPGAPGRGNINIGNEINIGGGNTIGSGNNIGNTKPWRPDPDRYRPGQGSKPGLARPGGPGRPGGVGGPGGPGGVGRPGAPGGVGGIGGPGPAGGVGGPGGPGGIGGVGGPGGPGGVGGIGGPGGPGGVGGALGGAAAGAIGGAAAGMIGQRPSQQPDRPDARPGQDRPQGGAGQGRPQADAGRPATRPSGPERPSARPPTAQARPAAPQGARPRPTPSRTAFDGIDAGRGAAAYGNRGAASRGQISMPAGRGGGGGQIGGGGRGGGAHIGGGGRGGGGHIGGGGGRGGGGGGRGGRR